MKKCLVPVCFLLFTSLATDAQNVGIGTNSPNASAALEIKATSKGLLIPRTSSVSRTAIVSPAKGLMVYDTTTNTFWFHSGSAWKEITTGSTGWGLSGNSGTDTSKNFIGTTDVNSLLVKVNKTPSGFIDVGTNQNTAWGYSALSSNTTGYYNVANGAYALWFNLTGVKNTANGYQALVSNESGSLNTAVGFSTLGANSTGSNNTAMGSAAMQGNTTGNYNTAFGYYALRYSSAGGYNTAVGANTLQNNTGDASYYNTAVGNNALLNTTNSQYNTAIGFNAGQARDNGYNNVFVGANTDVNGSGYYNVVAIGQGTICTASSQVTIGNGATSSYRAYANWTNISDGRYKKDLKENVKGIDFIMKLRPVTYHLDITGINEKLNENSSRKTDAVMKRAVTEKEKIVQSGFVAQDVEKAAKEVGYDFSGVDKPANDESFYGLRYADFVVPLVKAAQEQQAIIEEQNKKIAALQKENEKLKAMQADIEMLKAAVLKNNNFKK